MNKYSYTLLTFYTNHPLKKKILNDSFEQHRTQNLN